MKIQLSFAILFLFFSNTASAQWEKATGVNTTVFSFALIDSSIFGSTANGVIASTNNGADWTIPSNAGLTDQNVRPLAVLADTLIAGTFGTGIFRSRTGASSWTLDSGLQSQIVDDITINNNTIFIACEDGIFRSENN